jgi:ABC-type taurine transport system substrate-binding protein
MAAFDHSLIARGAGELNHLVARKNWAYKNPGVVLVFCIVGVVAILLIFLFVQKKLHARKMARGT